MIATKIYIQCLVLLFAVGCSPLQNSKPYAGGENEILPPRADGEMDIHHISTNRGNAAYIVMPDGTTLLIDAGDFDGERFARDSAPLKVGPPKPNASLRPGKAIAAYIKAITPFDRTPKIDYAIITHFHGDHYGEVRLTSPKSKKGNYRLSGITDVSEFIDISVLIDRAYPSYDEPVDFRICRGPSFSNYLSFQEYGVSHSAFRIEQLRAGARNQISLKHEASAYPSFFVQNIKANQEIWTGSGTNTKALFELSEAVNGKGCPSENALSIALTLNYGDFDYFAGGDMTGMTGNGSPKWFDVETPVGDIVGEVDVLSLNHHGNRDATNSSFLAALSPRVIVQQSWTSDQPGQELVHRLSSRALWAGERDVFSTYMAEETKAAIGPIMDRTYREYEGHIVVRVAKGGGAYRVFVLDDTDLTPRIKSSYGPYQSRARTP